jgi:hypothetical protein
MRPKYETMLDRGRPEYRAATYEQIGRALEVWECAGPNLRIVLNVAFECVGACWHVVGDQKHHVKQLSSSKDIVHCVLVSLIMNIQSQSMTAYQHERPAPSSN